MIMPLFITFVVFNRLQQKLRADRYFISFVSAWHIRCCETEWFQGWIIYASNTVISSNTETHLYSFSLEERKAERRLLCNGKLVVIMLKIMIKFNILF